MRIAKNIGWNALGTLSPLLAAFIAVPELIKALGTTRFGILSLAWVVIAYFSFFDFGLGRAMTQLIAKKIGEQKIDEIPAVIRSGMAILISLGLVAGIVVAGISPWLVEKKLSIPEQMQSEALVAFFFLSATLPITIITAGLRGILEGLHRFDIVNIVKAPLAVLTYLAPLAALPFSKNLAVVIACMSAVRLLSLVIYTSIYLRIYPAPAQKTALQANLLRQLLTFGGWMTLSNITAPLLLYLGRFALAILISAEAVAYFSTPYDIVINLLLIPGICVNVLFPTFAENFAQQKISVEKLYSRWLLLIFLLMLPLCTLTYFYAKPALGWWINLSFSENSYRIAQLLAIGVFINSFGHLSQALVQAYGRPDLTAKLHLAELIIYVPYMYYLIKLYGTEGAAISWIIRVTISTIVLSILAKACLSGAIKTAYEKQNVHPENP